MNESWQSSAVLRLAEAAAGFIHDTPCPVCCAESITHAAGEFKALIPLIPAWAPAELKK